MRMSLGSGGTAVDDGMTVGDEDTTGNSLALASGDASASALKIGITETLVAGVKTGEAVGSDEDELWDGVETAVDDGATVGDDDSSGKELPLAAGDASAVPLELGVVVALVVGVTTCEAVGSDEDDL